MILFSLVIGTKILLLTKKDGFNLTIGVKGTLLGNSTTSSTNAHKMILIQPAICWNVNYNGLDLITNYFAQLNNAIAHSTF